MNACFYSRCTMFITIVRLLGLVSDKKIIIILVAIKKRVNSKKASKWRK